MGPLTFPFSQTQPQAVRSGVGGEGEEPGGPSKKRHRGSRTEHQG